MHFRPAIALTLAAILSLGAVPPASASDPVAHRVPVDAAGHRVGGLSGLAVLDHGARFVAISDRGYLVEGVFDRDGSDPVAARVTQVTPLGGLRGRPLDRRRNEEDSEGLAIASDGSLIVTFEHVHRMVKYRDPAVALPYPAFLKGLELAENGGMEALAIDAQDRLIVIPEVSTTRTDHPLMRLENGKWEVIGRIHPSNGFLPVGADIGPDGMYYLLERKVATFGFRSRIRRFDLSQTGGVFDGETLWRSGTSLGNLEGLAIWTDAQGAMHATMVADDNFSSVLYGGMVTLRLAKTDGNM